MKSVVNSLVKNSPRYVPSILLVTGLMAQQSNRRIPIAEEIHNIVLVHGAWADGSNWQKVITPLTRRGFHVVAVQNPLASLQGDVTATQQAIARLQKTSPGPVLLVGHSYGGAVISEAGNDPSVVGLVFVAAYAPDAGESTLSLATSYPTPISDQYVFDEFGFSTLSREGIFDDFAQDLSLREKEVLYAAQAPTSLMASSGTVSSPAWRSKPTWFVIAAQDRTISPVLEQMEATRMKATTITLPTSHLALLSQPELVADFIAYAAESFRRGREHSTEAGDSK